MKAPNAIAAGSDGNLWFTEYSVNKIGRMKPSGETTYFPLPEGLRKPGGNHRRPRRRALVHEPEPAGVVTRITTDGQPAAFPLPAEKYPDEITAGPDDALWFSVGRTKSRG